MKYSLRVVLCLGLGAVLLGLAAGPARAAAGETSQNQTTDHYKITLTLGPAATMLMPDQAAGAKEGEVAVGMPGMSMPPMSDTDQGQPVNHHLEIAVADKTTGAVVKDQMPAITIKNDTTGASRTLAEVMAMYDVQVGENDYHFGNNVYLADGTYTITAVINGETATFAGLQVGAAPAPASGTMDMGGGSTMPATGTPQAPWYAALLLAGSLSLGAGLLLRRARRAI